jgi:hypothetical protein
MGAGVTAKRKQVVVWAVVWNDEDAMVRGTGSAYRTRKEAEKNSSRHYQRIVRCVGSLPVTKKAKDGARVRPA